MENIQCQYCSAQTNPDLNQLLQRVHQDPVDLLLHDTPNLDSTGCGKKSRPLKFLAVFSATVRNFNLKFYRIIY